MKKLLLLASLFLSVISISAQTSNEKKSISITCGVPSGLTVVSITDSSAKLEWTVVFNAFSYNVQYKEVNASTWSTVNTKSNSFTVAGLTPLSRYEYQVQTLCELGTSSFSTSYSFNTIDGAVSCGTPVEFRAYSIIDVSATISWKAIAEATSYNIQYRVKGAESWMSGNTTGNLFVVVGLDASTRYEYQVQTVCAAGKSDYTASCFFNTLATRPNNNLINLSNEVSQSNPLSIYPNPAVNSATVSYTADADNMITIRLYDITGKTISKNEYSALKGFNIYALDLNTVNKGLYMVEINNGRKVTVKKLYIDK